MEWLRAILQSIVVLMISPKVPPADHTTWRGAEGWSIHGQVLSYSAESEKVLAECVEKPTQSLVTPILAQGVHQLLLDDKVVLTTGDSSFSIAANFYNYAEVPCKDLLNGKKVTWRAFTQTKSLAKLNRFPSISSPGGLSAFFRETINVMIPGTLIGLGLLCLLIFYGKVERALITAILTVCGCASVTFALFVPGAFQLHFPQNKIQSVSDIALWIAFSFTGRIFHLLGYTTHGLLKILNTLLAIGIAIIFISGNLDQEQIGSNIAFIGVYIFLFGTLLNRKLLGGNARYRSRNEFLRSLAVLIFIIAGLNDLLMFQIPLASEPLGPFGFFCCTALLALAVNDRVVEAYEERDYLRANLEKEVERKTEALQKKSTELEHALDSLKIAQADLVQSAKLASLGTLSAGIAHEINNALNYVNGAIEPINTLLKKDQLNDMDRGKATKLLKLMKEGLDLTFGIIVNLKRHTNSATGTTEKLNLREVVEGTLLLLKGKLSGVEVSVNIDPSLCFDTARVSLSQVLMNLFTNAVDAIEDSVQKGAGHRRKIVVEAFEDQSGVTLSVLDSGSGIPPEIRERIFDPFFTTKAVGKGTGLGLHIVLSEVNKLGGKVSIENVPEMGAKFILFFPRVEERRAA